MFVGWVGAAINVVTVCGFDSFVPLAFVAITTTMYDVEGSNPVKVTVACATEYDAGVVIRPLTRKLYDDDNRPPDHDKVKPDDVTPEVTS